jgi:hypothetical protein
MQVLRWTPINAATTTATSGSSKAHSMESGGTLAAAMNSQKEFETLEALESNAITLYQHAVRLHAIGSPESKEV